MELNLEIGIYRVIRRTEYSKTQLFNKFTNENITDVFPGLAEKIVEDYNKQRLHPENYFYVEGGRLTDINREYINDIDYVFVPYGVELMEIGVFADTSIKQINLPSSLKYIEEQVFSDCSKLEYIELPDSILDIRAAAFAECENLKGVKLPSSLKFISEQMFSHCSQLKNITIPDSVLHIGPRAFLRCEHLEDIKLPKDLKIIQESAFHGCIVLNKINLPDTLEQIGNDCFGWSGLEKIDIPDTVYMLGSGVFSGCENLKYAKLPNNLKLLQKNTFFNCMNLTYLELPDDIKKIEEYVFTNTRSLENINIPKDLKSIGALLFSSSAVKSLTINNDLRELETYSIIPFGGAQKFINTNVDLLYKSKIDKLIINNSVKKITPELLGVCGKQIKKIDYLGTEEEFKKFKKYNRSFFTRLINLEEINFLGNVHAATKEQISSIESEAGLIWK